jgi:lipoprotein-anchoring transpeptidase ErfK/SrfK
MKLNIYRSIAAPGKRLFPFLMCLAFVISGFLISGALTVVNAQPRTVNRRANQGEQILEAEKILSGLGYWITKVDGVADASTRHAITAFQKVEGRKRTGVLTGAELDAMRNAARPVPKSSSGAAHVEIDIRRQVLFLVSDSGSITHILPVSSGNEQRYFDEGKWQIAHTPRGNFTITRRINGVRHAPLGSLYYPNYFTGGVAIHGSNSVPAYPASHGCVRIPNFAARDFFNLVSLGMPVMVYE